MTPSSTTAGQIYIKQPVLHRTFSIWIVDALLSCRAPGCPYYLPRMPSCRLSLICTAIVWCLVDECCDTWRLMACINDTPAGEREASFLLPSFAIKLESHPEQQTRISPQTGISTRANHNGKKHKQNKLLDLFWTVPDTQANNTHTHW